MVDTFLGVLNLASGRATSEDVLSLLESEAVRDRFEMTADDIEAIENWIEESGIRWGIDAEHREELGQPPFENNSWRFGLDRMLLGVALREGENTLWEGRLPCHLVEGTRSVLLGKGPQEEWNQEEAAHSLSLCPASCRVSSFLE